MFSVIDVNHNYVIITFTPYMTLSWLVYIHVQSTFSQWQQEGILHARACIRWTTIVWAHQIWWREIKNSRIGTVLLKAISLVLWIPYFPAKIFSMTKIGCFLCGFSLVDFSAVGVLGLLMTFKTQCQKVMFLYKSDFHWLSNAFL